MTPHIGSTSPPRPEPPGPGGHMFSAQALAAPPDPDPTVPGRDEALLQRWVEYLTAQWKDQVVTDHEHDARTSSQVSSLTTQVEELGGQVRAARDEVHTMTGVAFAAILLAAAALVATARLVRRVRTAADEDGQPSVSGVSVVVLDDPPARVRVG